MFVVFVCYFTEAEEKKEEASSMDAEARTFERAFSRLMQNYMAIDQTIQPYWRPWDYLYHEGYSEDLSWVSTPGQLFGVRPTAYMKRSFVRYTSTLDSTFSSFLNLKEEG